MARLVSRLIGARLLGGQDAKVAGCVSFRRSSQVDVVGAVMESHEVLGADGFDQVRVCTPHIERRINDCTE